MAYDHLFRAGNRADIVKHSALSAALSTLLETHSRAHFVYADTYSGYACSPLVSGYGWQDGLARLLRDRTQAEADPHLSRFIRTYFDRGIETEETGLASSVRGVYPGSSLIAFDLCKNAKIEPDLRLFDISLAAIASIQGVFRERTYTIVGCPAVPGQPLLVDADFIFVDPPGVRGSAGKSAPKWSDVVALVTPSSKAVLLWMPVMGGGDSATSHPGEGVASSRWRHECLERDGTLRASRILWKQSGQDMLGSQLIYRLPAAAGDAVRKTLETLVSLPAWKANVATRDAVTHF